MEEEEKYDEYKGNDEENEEDENKHANEEGQPTRGLSKDVEDLTPPSGKVWFRLYPFCSTYSRLFSYAVKNHMLIFFHAGRHLFYSSCSRQTTCLTTCLVVC